MVNITPDISKLIDSRSFRIWEQVKEYYNPTLKFHDEGNYKCVTSENPIGIYVTQDNYNVNYFAHELLHLQLRMEGIDISQPLITQYRERPSLIKILGEQSLNGIINALEHLKMFPRYVDAKFNVEEFTVDYQFLKAGVEDIVLKLIYFDGNSVSSQVIVEEYINIFFSMKSNQNPKFDYRDQLLYLQDKDQALYKILNDFWDDWVKIDATVKHTLPGLVSKFYTELELWIKNKYG